MRGLVDHQGHSIRLTQERLNHILARPEMVDMESQLEETLHNPEQVVQSTADPDVHLYYRRYTDTVVGDKLLCIVVKITAQDGFVITAYLTDKVKRGATLWQRSG